MSRSRRTPVDHTASEHGHAVFARSPVSTAVAVALLSLNSAWISGAAASPTGGQVAAGAATIQQPTAQSTIVNQSTPRAVLNWQSFGIGAGESVVFKQPSPSAVALNRVVGPQASVISGTLQANGHVFLVNPSGVLFSKGASVDVGGLVASTLAISNTGFMSGQYVFSGGAGSGAVVNEGSIRAADGGYVALIGNQVSNSGTIVANAGSVALGAGDTILLDFEGDGLMSLKVNAAAAAARIDHGGVIEADGGRVIMSAQAKNAVTATAVNVDGIVRARGLEQRNGEIFLDGGRSGVTSVSGTLDASSANAGQKGGDIRVLGEYVGFIGNASLDASGMAGGGTVLVGGDFQGGNSNLPNAFRSYVGADTIIKADAITGGDGGKVIVWAEDWTKFYGSISARGGANGGDGGFAEVSGKQHLVFLGAVNLAAPQGSVGTLLLDPRNIFVVAGGTPDDVQLADNQILFADGGSTDFMISNTALETSLMAANTTLQANNDISFGAAVTAAGGGFDLTVQAGRTITVSTPITANGAGRITMIANNTAGGETDAAGGALTGSGASADRGAGPGNLVLNAAITAGSGAIKLVSSGATTNNGVPGDVALGNNVTTTGNVTIAANGGAITRSAGTVTGALVTLGAATGVGSAGGAGAINTAATTVAASNSASGNVDVIGVDAVSVSGSNTGGGAFNVTAGGAGNTLTVSAGNINANTGSVTLQADEMVLTGTVTGDGGVTLRPNTAGTPITLEVGTAGLDFTNTALQQVFTTGVLTLGADSAPAAGSITIDGPLAGGANWNTLSLRTAGAVVDGNAAAGADITVASLAIRAATGIGSAGNPLETALTNFAFSNTGAGGVAIANTGALTIASVDGLSASNGGAGTLTLSAASPLTIAADIIQSGSIDLTAGENAVAGAGDDLTVNTGVTVRSTAGDVTLRAGDQVTLAGTALVESTAGGGMLTLIAGVNDNDGAGAINGTGSARADFVALDSLTGVGSSGTRFNTTAGTLAARSRTSGGVFVTEADAVTLNTIGALANASADNVYDVTAAGPIAVAGAVSAVGAVILQGAGVTSTAAATISTVAAANSGTPSGEVAITATGTGAIDLAGLVLTRGAESNAGAASAGGNATFSTNNGAISVATVNARGGDATAGNTSGGNAGTIAFNAGGGNTLTLNGDLISRGGDAAGTGDAGTGRTIDIAAPTRLGADVLVVTRRGSGAGAATAGNITFSGTLESPGIARNLTLTTGATTTFGAALGGNGNPLGLITTDAGGTTALNGGAVTTTGAQTYNDPVTLGAGAVLTSTGSGNMTFGSTVNGAQALAVNTGGTTTFAGDVGTTQPLIDLDITAGSIVFNAAASQTVNVSAGTGGATATFAGPLALGQNLTVVTDGANDNNVSFTSTVDADNAAANDRTLTVDAGSGGTIDVAGAIGGTQPLAGLTVANSNGATFSAPVTVNDGAGAIALANTTAGRTIAFTNDVTANTLTTMGSGYNVSLTGSSAAIAGDTNFVNTGTVTLGDAAGDVLLFGGGLATAANATNPALTNIAGTVRSAGVQIDLGAVTLTGNATIDSTNAGAVAAGANANLTSTGPGNIAFASTIDGAFALGVNTAGASSFAAPVGATTALASLSTDAAGTTALNGGSITTSGAQTYNDAIMLGANTTLATTAGGAITASSSVNGAFALAANTSGATTFGGAAGNTAALASLTTDAGGTTALNGGSVTTTGAQTYGDGVTFGADAFLSSTGGGAITLGAGANGAFALTANTAGITALGGVIGDVAALTALTTDAGGTTALNGSAVTTSGNQTYNDAVALRANPTLTSTGGDVAFASTIDADAAANNRALTVNASVGTVTFFENIGASQALADLDVIAGPTTIVFNGAPSQTVNVSAQGGNTATFDAPLVVATNLSVNSDGAADNNVVFAGTVNADAFANNRTLTVTSGTATTTFAAAVGDTQELGALAVSAGQLTLGGNVSVTGGGAVDLSNVMSVAFVSGMTLDTDRAAGATAAGDVVFNAASFTNTVTPDASLAIDASADNGGAAGDVALGTVGNANRLDRLGVLGDTVTFAGPVSARQVSVTANTVVTPTGQIRASQGFNNNAADANAAVLLRALTGAGQFGTRDAPIQIDAPGLFVVIPNMPNTLPFVFLAGDPNKSPVYQFANDPTHRRVFYNGAAPDSPADRAAQGAITQQLRTLLDELAMAGFANENIRKQLLQGIVLETGLARPGIDEFEGEGVTAPPACEPEPANAAKGALIC